MLGARSATAARVTKIQRQKRRRSRRAKEKMLHDERARSDTKAKRGRVEGISPEECFVYQPASDAYLCPAGQPLRRRRHIRRQRVWE